MSLNMYLGEVQAQSQSMNTFCFDTIQGMEQAINAIDAFVFDAVLQGQTYDSAKTFFAQTFRPLAQGIIYLCEELIHQNHAFPNDFQSQVATTDVLEQEILEQIREIERTKKSIEVISNSLPGMQAMINICNSMRGKLQEKLEHLYKFNYTSSSNYNAALQLAACIAQGLAETQSGKSFNPITGTFNTQGLNMEWTSSIQKIAEDKARQADKKKQSKTFEGGYKTFKGSSEWSQDGRYRGNLEGSLIEGGYKLSKRSKLDFKAGYGKLEANLPYKSDKIGNDIVEGNIIGFKGELTGAEVSLAYKVPYVSEISVTQKYLDSSAALGIDEYTFKRDAEVTIKKYEAKLDRIDIPDSIPYLGKYDLEIRGEYGLGTYGYKFHTGKENGVYVGAGEYGGGIFIKFKKEEK